MWADMLPGRCASLNMSKNNPPACPIAKPGGLAAVLQWDKYYTTHYRETPGLGTCLDSEVKSPIFTLLALCWEFSTYFLAVAKPAGCRGGRSPQNQANAVWEGQDTERLCERHRWPLQQQGWGRDGPNQPKHGWGQRDEFKPSPARSLCSYSQHREQLCLGKSFFAFYQLYMAALGPSWRRAKDALTEGQRQPQPSKHLPQPWIISAAPQPTEEILPFAPFQIAWVQPGLQVMGIWMETDNVFLDLSGCQKSPHGNQAKLPMRAVEDKQVFVRQLQITARLQYSKQYQEFSHRKSWNPACLTAKPCVFNKGWKTI